MTRKSMKPGSVICLMRLYKDAPTDRNGEIMSSVKQMNMYSDAVMHRASKSPSIPSYCLTNACEWLINTEDFSILLDDDVVFNVLSIARKHLCEIQNVKIELRSKLLTTNELKAYIHTLCNEYATFMSQQLTSSSCIFEQKDKPNQDFRGSPYGDDVQRRQYDIVNAPKYLAFAKYPFFSNKTFDSLCGPDTKLVCDRVKFFIENAAWYNKKGVPYRLGILLSGESGSGKSSCIKAIANLTHRHIINVNFANIKTGTQLRRLFQSDDLHVYEDEEKADVIKLKIPLNQRLYVLEEIDAIGTELTNDRRLSNHASKERVVDEISLADILQVLDGTMEVPGRIVIMTSNYPERLDKALIRPGRIDLCIKFGNASRDTLIELYEKLTDKAFPPNYKDKLPEATLSVADATEVIFRNFESPVKQLISELCIFALNKQALETNQLNEIGIKGALHTQNHPREEESFGAEGLDSYYSTTLLHRK